MLSLHVNTYKDIEWNLEPLNAYKKSIDKAGLVTIIILRFYNSKEGNPFGGLLISINLGVLE